MSDTPARDVYRSWSAATVGIDAIPVEVEVHIRPGLPSYTVVGLAQASVRESRDRVFSALRASGLPVPRGAITVSLAPADLRKDGALFDLPLSMALLAAQGVIPANGRLDRTMVIGELALDGRVRPIRGALSVAVAARSTGNAAIMLPAENAAETRAVEGLTSFAAGTLGEAVAVMRSLSDGRPGRPATVSGAPTASRVDLADVVGQAGPRRALEIAAAGAHNLLMVGPPGAGKTMLARRISGILPDLTRDEALTVTRIHSVAWLLRPGSGLASVPPFRAPHHTVSTAGMAGGGDPPRPGEITLAHHGVLFLDELPEFRRAVLETLRQPLEDGSLVVSRARWRVEMPARFMLVAGMNPCPCGRLGSEDTACLCHPGQVRRYLARASGPLLDRIDMHIHVGRVPAEAWRRERGESSRVVADRVRKARAVQARRFGAASGGHTRRRPGVRSMVNGQLDAPGIRTWCSIDGAASALLMDATRRLGLSARAVIRVRGVARTIADLAGADSIRPEHVAEAVQYRTPDASSPVPLV